MKFEYAIGARFGYNSGAWYKARVTRVGHDMGGTFVEGITEGTDGSRRFTIHQQSTRPVITLWLKCVR